jgi:uncharacterized protein (DUF1697 family)
MRFTQYTGWRYGTKCQEPEMNTYIAFLRGINVGGNNILPMKELSKVLEDLGLENVKTYLASGNVVFQSEMTDLAGLSGDIKAAIGRSHGFTPQILIRSAQELRQAIATNPFPEGESEPKTLHAYFLESVPTSPDLAQLDSVKSASERYKLVDTVFYLYAPDGIGRSKMATSVEKALGVPATARNWRTVDKVMAMAAEPGDNND